MFCRLSDSPGWDGGRSNGFVNGYHDNRMNGGRGGFDGRGGAMRQDRGGGRGGFRGRGGSTYNPVQPMPNAGEPFPPLSLSVVECFLHIPLDQ